MEEKQYDLVVIGAGPGGYEAALRASKLGMKTAVVEKEQLGGTCLNRGCVPTKTLIYASELYRKASVEFQALGLSAPKLSYDMEKMYARKDEVLAKLRSGVAQLLKKGKVDVYIGTGQVESPETVMVTREIGVITASEGQVAQTAAPGSQAARIAASESQVVRTAASESDKLRLYTKRILIASGSHPAKPPVPGFDLPGVVTSDEMLADPDRSGGRLLIIGGGVIGVEFASIFSSLGYQVSIVEMAARILPPMDREVSQNLTAILKKRGVQIYTGAAVKEIRTSAAEDSLICVFDDGRQEQQLEADRVMVSIGRRAVTEGLFADGMEVSMERGCIAVDRNYQTSVPQIYAIGDVIGGVQLAHLATAEGIAAVENMAGASRSIDVTLVPACIFTDPEIATVGLTADQAKERGIPAKTCKASMMANGKSIIENQERGFIKLVYNDDSDVLLGAQLMCARATDLVAELAAAISAGLTREKLASVIRPHPTFCEGVTAALRE